MTYYDQVAEAAAFVHSRLGALAPRVGMVLGSGLGAAADAVADPVFVPCQEIPHFPQSTVEGHSGRIVAGLLGGAPAIILRINAGGLATRTIPTAAPPTINNSAGCIRT